jgi:hypothetical protein
MAVGTINVRIFPTPAAVALAPAAHPPVAAVGTINVAIGEAVHPAAVQLIPGTHPLPAAGGTIAARIHPIPAALGLAPTPHLPPVRVGRILVQVGAGLWPTVVALDPLPHAPVTARGDLPVDIHSLPIVALDPARHSIPPKTGTIRVMVRGSFWGPPPWASGPEGRIEARFRLDNLDTIPPPSAPGRRATRRYK